MPNEGGFETRPYKNHQRSAALRPRFGIRLAHMRLPCTFRDDLARESGMISPGRWSPLLADGDCEAFDFLSAPIGTPLPSMNHSAASATNSEWAWFENGSAGTT
jgi:hypothetical protein